MWYLLIGITSLMPEETPVLYLCQLKTSMQTQSVSAPLCFLNYDVCLTYNKTFSTSSPRLLVCFTCSFSEASRNGTQSLTGAKEMSTQIVIAVLCLWQGGIHSLQGSPSILLLKQWLCTQPIQGRENATQRDRNIKRLAIWGGRVPNNEWLQKHYSAPPNKKVEDER